MGDYKRALPTILPAIAAGESIAPGHPHLIRAYRTIGYEMYLAQRYGEAESFLRKVVDDAGVSPHRRRDTKMWLAENYVANREYQKAEQLYQSIERSGISTDFDAWYHHLGSRIRRGLGDSASADQLLRQAKRIADKSRKSGLAPTVLDNLARIYEACGDDENVERLLRRALEREQQVRPEKHPRTSDRMQRLAQFLLRDGRSPEVIPLLEKSLEIRQLRLPSSDVRIRQTRQLLESVTAR